MAPALCAMVSLLVISLRKVVRDVTQVRLHPFAVTQRTLRDYTHYILTRIGFSAEVDQYLISSIDLSSERKRYVILVMDEVHMKEDLVYNKHSGKLIGFVNLGETNNQLLSFESALASDGVNHPLANSMLVLMVRGLFNRLKFPYQYMRCLLATL